MKRMERMGMMNGNDNHDNEKKPETDSKKEAHYTIINAPDIGSGEELIQLMDLFNIKSKNNTGHFNDLDD